MVFREIKKNKLSFRPNMPDYNKAYKEFSYRKYHNELEWFSGKKLNAAYNAVDRHAKSWRKNKVALVYEPDEGTEKKYTFQDLSLLSNKFANVLKGQGVRKGDRIFLFMPRVPEQYISFLGILKTGAIAGTLFQAFGPAALLDRLGDSEAKIVITTTDMKQRIYEIKNKLPKLEKIILIDDEHPGKRFEISFWKEMHTASDRFEAVHTSPEDYAFMLYTSGTTGKPKGVIHAHLAILHEHMTARWVLDLKEDDTYWCTADPGWVTGIAYGILGIWSVGATSIVHNGRFSPERWYSILEKHKVSVWYTAPTAIRMLMKAGESIMKGYDLSSLRHLCSVGEPLNPEAVIWGNKAFGKPFHDTWWQTETGGQMIVNYPSLPIRPGSMGKPFPGIKATIVDDEGKELKAGKEGNLAIKPGWPSMMRAVWRNEKKYNNYFLKGWYLSGDKAMKDKDGYFWFIGRADDVIKTSGERVGPFEVESALVEHEAVAEAGVIGKPDAERGEIIKAFVVLNKGFRKGPRLENELKLWVKRHMAGHAYPREISFVDSLPKTRSGKIMRRVLKARELGLPIGDTSTLEEY